MNFEVSDGLLMLLRRITPPHCDTGNVVVFRLDDLLDIKVTRGDLRYNCIGATPPLTLSDTDAIIHSRGHCVYIRDTTFAEFIRTDPVPDLTIKRWGLINDARMTCAEVATMVDVGMPLYKTIGKQEDPILVLSYPHFEKILLRLLDVIQ